MSELTPIVALLVKDMVQIECVSLNSIVAKKILGHHSNLCELIFRGMYQNTP